MRASFVVLLATSAACAASAPAPAVAPTGPESTSLEYEPPPPEAASVLRQISERVTSYFNDNDHFPIGKATATPRPACCQGAERYCPATPEAWERGVWSDMGYSLDEPSQFRFAYQGTRRAFTITAVGDPECTGQLRTYVLTGRSTSRGRYVVDDIAMLQVE